jgi:maleate isomerase
LQDVLAAAGVETPAFGSFEEALEERVARISAASTIVAARALVEQAEVPVDGLFLSCTNLPTLDVIGPLENATGLPVLSSNLVLAWHMLTIAERSAAPGVPGRLFAQAPPG